MKDRVELLEDEDEDESSSGNDLAGNAAPQALVGTASDRMAQFMPASAGLSSSDSQAPSQGSSGRPSRQERSRTGGTAGGNRGDPTLAGDYRFRRSGWRGWHPTWEKVLTREGEVPDWYIALQEEAAASDTPYTPYTPRPVEGRRHGQM